MRPVDAMIPSDLQSAPNTVVATQDECVSKERCEVILRGGARVLIRPIRKQDIALERQFFEALSLRSRRFRFLDTIQSPSPALLKQMVEIDPSRDVAIIALIVGETGEQQIGVARLCAAADGRTCEFAVTVSDAWQRKGLGTHLMRRLIERATARGLESMYSVDSSDNDLMRGFAVHLGMRRETDPNDSTQVIHSLDLKTFDSAS
jgi:GNAT superfamily N-acetyltransferase